MNFIPRYENFNDRDYLTVTSTIEITDYIVHCSPWWRKKRMHVCMYVCKHTIAQVQVSISDNDNRSARGNETSPLRILNILGCHLMKKEKKRKRLSHSVTANKYKEVI